MAYIKPIKERLRAEIERLLIIYGIGEHDRINFRQVKIDLHEDIRQVLSRVGAASNTPIDIYMEADVFVVSVGEHLYRWN